MVERPDYIKCIKRDHADHIGESYCGRVMDTFEWYFVNADHAIENGNNGGRLIACSDCKIFINKSLMNGYE